MTVSSCRQKRPVAEPEAAYGPPGSTGEENISVVVAPIQPGFKLESLGTAEQAGRRFLETTVASINANREAKLLAAESRSAVLMSLLYVAQCSGCCVLHVCVSLLCGKLLCGSYCLPNIVCQILFARYCLPDRYCLPNIVCQWAALCQTHVSLLLFGLSFNPCVGT